MEAKERVASSGRLARRQVLEGAATAGLTAIAARSATAAEPKPPPARFIDVHNHPYWLGHDARKMVANMDRYGIARTWLLAWECPKHERSPSYDATLNPEGEGIRFADVVRMAEQYPDRFIPGWAPDPRRPETRRRLKAAVDLHGVRVYGEMKLRMTYDSPDALSIFQLCAELGLPVLFHLDVTLPRGTPAGNWQYWYGGHIDAVERAMQACPDTVFIGHAPGFWREISGDAEQEPSSYPRGKPIVPGGRILQLLDKYPGLHCDISAGSGHTALSRDLDFTRKFCIDYQDRILHGRDGFDNNHMTLLRALHLPDNVFNKIMFGNAERLVPQKGSG